jgi:hypothetical protein
MLTTSSRKLEMRTNICGRQGGYDVKVNPIDISGTAKRRRAGRETNLKLMEGTG